MRDHWTLLNTLRSFQGDKRRWRVRNTAKDIRTSPVYSWFVSSTKTFQSAQKSEYLLNHHTRKENKSFTFRMNPPKIKDSYSYQSEKQSTEGLRISQRGDIIGGTGRPPQEVDTRHYRNSPCFSAQLQAAATRSSSVCFDSQH